MVVPRCGRFRKSSQISNIDGKQMHLWLYKRYVCMRTSVSFTLKLGSKPPTPYLYFYSTLRSLNMFSWWSVCRRQRHTSFIYLKMPISAPYTPSGKPLEKSMASTFFRDPLWTACISLCKRDQCRPFRVCICAGLLSCQRTCN